MSRRTAAPQSPIGSVESFVVREIASRHPGGLVDDAYTGAVDAPALPPVVGTAITSVCRVRPPLGLERQDRTALVIDGSHANSVTLTGVRGVQTKFDFTAVFGPNDPISSLFDSVAIRFADTVVREGKNATVLFYGQTGAGKTHAMQELVPFFLMRVLESLPAHHVQFSSIEIYNNEVFDMLRSDRGPLTVYDAGDDGIRLPGLSCATITNLDDALWFVEYAASLRTTESTAMNSRSSRSHAMFKLYCKLSDSAGDRVAKLSLVDLGGSERNKRTLNTGVRMKESVGINSDLLALGNVLRAVADKRSHVPYRACRLTRLLQDAIGGNCATLLVGCVAPTQVNAEESLRTLQYAALASTITNYPSVVQPHVAAAPRAASREQPSKGMPPATAASPPLTSPTPNKCDEPQSTSREQRLQDEVNMLRSDLLRLRQLLEVANSRVITEVHELRLRQSSDRKSLLERLAGVEERQTSPRIMCDRGVGCLPTQQNRSTEVTASHWLNTPLFAANVPSPPLISATADVRSLRSAAAQPTTVAVPRFQPPIPGPEDRRARDSVSPVPYRLPPCSPSRHLDAAEDAATGAAAPVRQPPVAVHRYSRMERQDSVESVVEMGNPLDATPVPAPMKYHHQPSRVTQSTLASDEQRRHLDAPPPLHADPASKGSKEPETPRTLLAIENDRLKRDNEALLKQLSLIYEALQLPPAASSRLTHDAEAIPV